jgi:acetyl-CoA synthetase
VTSTPTPDLSSGVWQPSAVERDRSRILAFANHVRCDDLDALRECARAEPAWFWGAVADWLQLDWQRQPDRTVDQLDVPHQSRWFVGGELNITDNAVDRWLRLGRGADDAVLWELENGTRGAWTFSELAAEVDRVGAGLLALGIGFGDTVGIQLPMVREAVVAQLACAKIGAISIPIFSGFGAAAVSDRLTIAGATAHIIGNGFHRRGKTVAVQQDLADALGQINSLSVTVIVDLVAGTTVPTMPGAVGWDDLPAGPDPLVAARIPTDHPLCIAFTSGTTGTPKGVVLGHAGFAVKAGSDAAFSFDLGPGDVATWITDPGWIMSPIIVLGGLMTGSSVALYAGTPDWPHPDRLWDMVRALGITMMGVSPTLVRTLMSAGADRPVDVGPLRVLASSGEAWTPDAYDWLFSHVGKKAIPIINYSGGTEVSGAILSNTTAEPIHPCGFAAPLAGMGADIVDAEGNSLGRGLGELALRNPSPGMPLGFWGDPERYYTTYWDRWPRVWHHGDWVEVDQDDIWYVRGRSDDTLKIASKRLGSAEVESVVNSIPRVVESAAIGVPDPLKGEALVVFARVGDHDGHADLADEIAGHIGARLGKPLAPKRVHIVHDLPRTRSGKILRRVIRSAYLGDAAGDTSAIDDPSTIDAIRVLK